MKNWHDETVTISNECPWIDDSNDALIVANKLKIPFQTLTLAKNTRKKLLTTCSQNMKMEEHPTQMYCVIEK